jgi:hypothetical protein
MANLAGFLTLGAALGRAQLPGGESANYVAGSDCPTRFVAGLSVLAWQAQAAWGVPWEGQSYLEGGCGRAGSPAGGSPDQRLHKKRLSVVC